MVPGRRRARSIPPAGPVRQRVSGDQAPARRDSTQSTTSWMPNGFVI
jgi:hypothetical protein